MNIFESLRPLIGKLKFGCKQGRLTTLGSELAYFRIKIRDIYIIHNDFALPSAYHYYILVSNPNFEVTTRKRIFLKYYFIMNRKEKNKEEIIYMIKSIKMINR